MTRLTGSCSCGAVRFVADADARQIVNCHCGLCRKMNGAAFSSYVVIPAKTLSVTGEHNVATYGATPEARKHLCARCGTPLFNVNARYAGACMLYLGAVEPPPAAVPSVNVYCESMLEWIERVGSIDKRDRGADGQ